MEIKKASSELSKVEIYKMCKSPEVKSIGKEADNIVIDVAEWVLYEDPNHDGEIVEILSILDASGTAYACTSATFKRSFFEIAEIMGEDGFSIRKISGTTKAGRPYINCVLDI